MSTLEIKRPVLIKVIITEKFKQELISDAQTALADIESKIKSVETGGLPSSQMDELTKMREEFRQKITDFQNVAIGAELPFRAIEGIAQVAVGDNLLQKIAQTEVVVKDWIVQEIRFG